MSTYSPPPSQLGRRQHDFLVSNGYEYLGPRGGGHYAYKHPGHGLFFVSGTGYDAKGWQAFKSEMRKLFPSAFRPGKSDDAPARERTRLQAAPDLPPEVAARVREKQAEARNARRAAEEQQAAPIMPDPGTPKARALGCLCPPRSREIVELYELAPGQFAHVKDCRLHGWEDAPEPTGPVCECGTPIHQKGSGRRRKYCESCRPSRWKQMSQEQRDRQREFASAWRERNNQRMAA